MSSTGKRCKATTKTGQPCQVYACTGSDFCFWHDPGQAAARQAGRRRGGLARQGRKVHPSGGDDPVRIEKVGDVLPLLERVINDVLAMESSIARARTVGYLAGVAVKTLELTELADRLARLEEIVSANEGRRASRYG